MRYSLFFTTQDYINGYWDGGKKKYFKFNIDNIQKDKKGYYCTLGCFEGNFWFNISCGKNKVQSEKQIFKNALKTKILKNFIEKYKAKWEIIERD